MSGDPITFAPGSTETTYTITLLPDDTFEGGNEQVVVSLRAIDVPGAEPVVISQGQFTLNIIEDDCRSHDMSHGCSFIVYRSMANKFMIAVTYPMH